MKKQAVISIGGRYNVVIPLRQFRCLVEAITNSKAKGAVKIQAKMKRLQSQLEFEKTEHQFYRKVFTTIWPLLTKSKVIEVHPIHIQTATGRVNGITQLAIRLVGEVRGVKVQAVCSAEDQFDRKCGLGVCLWKLIDLPITDGTVQEHLIAEQLQKICKSKLVTLKKAACKIGLRKA